MTKNRTKLPKFICLGYNFSENEIMRFDCVAETKERAAEKAKTRLVKSIGMN